MAIATCIQTPTRFQRRVVANGTAIPIGTIMKLTDGNVAIASSTNSDPWGGVAWEEKTASDGITEITCAMNGRWSMTSTAAAITAGGAVSIGGANAVRASTGTADVVAGAQLGSNRILNTLGVGGGTAIVEID